MRRLYAIKGCTQCLVCWSPFFARQPVYRESRYGRGLAPCAKVAGLSISVTIPACPAKAVVASFKTRRWPTAQTHILRVQCETATRSREKHMGGKAQSLEYTMERVDGGGNDVIGTRLTAAQELDRCRLKLGRRDYGLICRICGEGRSLGELFSTNREKTTPIDVLRTSLDDLAGMWGMYRQN